MREKILKSVVVFLIDAIATAIITVVVTSILDNQPIAGLTKLAGLYRAFIKGSVPAWLFAAVLLVALYGLFYLFTHRLKRRPVGKVHFIADAQNCGWSEQTETKMNVRVGGTFTYDESGELFVLKGYLKGTQPTIDWIVQVPPLEGSPPGSRMISVSELLLPPRLSQRTFIAMVLTPVLGTPGKPLRRKLVLRDKYNREFMVGPIEFPYTGTRAK